MKRLSFASYFSYFSLALIVTVLLLTTLSTAWADGLSQGYATTDSELKPGMIVALTAESTAGDSAVERGSIENIKKIIGLAVGATQNSVVISTAKQQIFVQATGNAHGYVADLNGAVKKGDLLTISPLKGIMMRAEGTTTDIVAIALEDFSTDSAETYTIQTDSGSKQAQVAKIDINLDHKGAAAGQVKAEASTLAALGYAVTGHDTSELRIITALIVFLLILIAEGGIIYGAVSSSIRAVGRNPLATKMIQSELVRVLFVALFVLTLGAGIIYILMWS